MKQAFSILSVLFGFFISSAASGQTQNEMNIEAQENFQKADKELNLVYNQILKEYESDKEFIKNLRAAQRLWIQFRDAEVKAKFPDREQGYYGSIQPLCWNIYKMQLTQERTEKLRIWLNGIEEGDGCSGSVKIKWESQ